MSCLTWESGLNTLTSPANFLTPWPISWNIFVVAFSATSVITPGSSKDFGTKSTAEVAEELTACSAKVLGAFSSIVPSLNALISTLLAPKSLGEVSKF